MVTQSAEAEVLLEGLSLVNGAPDDDEDGAAILTALGTDLTLRDCLVAGHDEDRFSSAIWVRNSRLTVEDSEFRDDANDAIDSWYSQTRIVRSRFGAFSGLGVWGGHVTVEDSEFVDASSSVIVLTSRDASLDVVRTRIETTHGSGSRAIWSMGLNDPIEHRITLTGSTISGFRSSALRLDPTEVELVVTDTTFEDNTGTDGAAIDLNGGSMTVVGSRFVNNVASREGGAIRAVLEGEFVIEDSEFVGNSASLRGGAVYVTQKSFGDPLTVQCRAGTGHFGFFGNSADEGAALFLSYSDVATPFVSQGCDFGEGANDNVTDPDDGELCIDTPSGWCAEFDFGNDASFTCTEGGCE